MSENIVIMDCSNNIERYWSSVIAQNIGLAKSFSPKECDFYILADLDVLANIPGFLGVLLDNIKSTRNRRANFEPKNVIIWHSVDLIEHGIVPGKSEEFLENKKDALKIIATTVKAFFKDSVVYSFLNKISAKCTFFENDSSLVQREMERIEVAKL